MHVHRPLRALLPAVVLGAALLAPGSALAAAPQSTAAALESPQTRVHDGGGMDLVGRVTSSDRDDTGHRVVLESRGPGQDTWQQMSASTTSGDPRRHTDGAALWHVSSLHRDDGFRLVHPAQVVRGRSFAASTSRVVTARVGGPRTFSVVDDGHDRSMRFDVFAGDSVTFSADECQDCGYSWSVTQPTDARIVEKTGDASAVPDHDRPGVVGGSGLHSYAWKARAARSSTSAGRTSTTLTYSPPGRGARPDHVVRASFSVFP